MGSDMQTIALALLIAALSCGLASAQSPPGRITGGATGVTVDGKPAARVGDTTSDGKIVEGANGVFINGKPAAVVGGSTDCGGVTTSGSHGVFINGKPMARQGDTTSACPAK